MARRHVVGVVQDGFDVRQRRACPALGAARSRVRYVRVRGDDPIGEPRRAPAARRPRDGYRRLAVRRKKRTRLAAGARRPVPAPTQANVRWAMDVTTDTLATGRPFRTLNIVEDGSREGPAIVVDHGISGVRITRELDRLAVTRPLPQTIVVDNGPEFTSRALDQWAYERDVTLHFIRPGQPVDNAYVESFNGKFRDECLNEAVFLDLLDARTKIAAYRVDYNTVRPHSALGDRTPTEYATEIGLAE
ncbi:MAG TPA: integrase core domain-containing protein [Candidatus Binatia bacterium]|nr:integrase core domain-containing protein [Candidatus Binatia bacterium]